MPSNGGVGAHPLVEQEAAGQSPAKLAKRVGDDRHQRLGLVNDRRAGVKRQRVGRLPVAAGDDQRVILGRRCWVAR